MSFPWVSRERLNEVRDALTAERLKNAALFERYHDLVLKSAPPATITSVNAAPVAVTPPIPPKRSIIATAIREEAQGDVRLASFLERRSRQLKAEGKTDAEIADQIRLWETTEEKEA